MLPLSVSHSFIFIAGLSYIGFAATALKLNATDASVVVLLLTGGRFVMVW